MTAALIVAVPLAFAVLAAFMGWKLGCIFKQ